MDRQAQFKARQEMIFETAERLLLENGELGMTLDLLASELDLAKGTLYKHFQSKDELYMLLILRHEKILLEMFYLRQSHTFIKKLEYFILYHLNHPERTILYHLLEEKLANVAGVQSLFRQLYQVRKQRLKETLSAIHEYLLVEKSKIPARDYIAMIWSLVYGAAMLLNSSFYQRYLGSRETLKRAYVKQALDIPKSYL
ncbi:TetR/AcrR family transcriptional regulator [Acinetobacter sp. ESL0695]|uniref:TetR/AcrR family transcriptional regulator n=1 Tax=Acinetobacter pollinis TaxID=2605270 RepID=A0ABU6DRC1_9GAMM|nr:MULTISPECIES: TetR/AcrR family transcriptional regulator [Acinetobacter]MEB5476207.1 TetR/AcrR family transcriptional regulator [Acinetobacter pollinis]WEV47897.1 TetR/AcrR family transcriptional regulator [Acinetobacter sp. ESL0695]